MINKSACQERLLAQYQRLVQNELHGRNVTPEMSEDYLRQWARSRAIADGVSLTEEQLDAFVELHRAGDRQFQSTLDRALTEIRGYTPQMAEQETRIGAAPIYNTSACVGAFSYPDAAFDSSTVPTDDGDYLILVNQSLLEMLWQASKILVKSTLLKDGQFAYLDDVRLGLGQLSPAEALAEIIGVYIGVDSTSRGAVERPVGSDQARAEQLYHACITFVVGHEYAHILAGHVDQDIELHAGKYTEELEDLNEVAADWLAAKFLLADWRWGEFVDDEWNTHFQTLIAAPLLFFALEAAVDRAEVRTGQTRSWSVAPPAIRKRWLVPLYDEIAGRDYRQAYPLAHDYEDWIYRMMDGISDEVDRLRSQT